MIWLVSSFTFGLKPAFTGAAFSTSRASRSGPDRMGGFG